MKKEPKSYTKIGGMEYDTKNVKTPNSGRSFRDAWAAPDGAGVIQIDMTKARDIHRKQMREARSRRFAELDTQYMRYDEEGDNEGKQSVAQQKKLLRDVTSLSEIENATTPESLSLVWPDYLGPKGA